MKPTNLPKGATIVTVGDAIDGRLFQKGTIFIDTFVGRRQLIGIDARMWGHDTTERSWCLHGDHALIFIPHND